MKLMFYDDWVEICECCGPEQEGFFIINGQKIHSYPYPNPVVEFGTPTDSGSFVNGYIQCLIDNKILSENEEIVVEYFDEGM